MDLVHWALAWQCQISIPWRLIVVSSLYFCHIYLPYPYPSSAHEHWNENGKLTIGLMQHLKCTSTFKIFEPHAEFHEVCPKLLAVCEGEHSHFVPLPTKIPPPICDIILKLVGDLGPDLPDITPRRFLWHTITCDYLMKRFPGIHAPMLMDLHASLANWEHICAYIKQAVQTFYPHGTGWKGNCYE